MTEKFLRTKRVNGLKVESRESREGRESREVVEVVIWSQTLCHSF
jgi:hypothetical protein